MALPLIVMWAPLLLVLVPSGSADTVPELVEQLASAVPEVREEAARSLALALVPGDTAVFAGALRGLDSAEARRRASLVLGGEDRLLGTAVELALDPSMELAAVGTDALRAQLLRWSVSAFDEPETAAFDPRRVELDLPRTWTRRATLELSIDPRAGGLVAALDRLDRHGRGLAPIVLDPRLVARELRRPDPGAGPAARLDGTWSTLLRDLCLLHGAAFQVQGYRFPGEERPDDRATGDGALAQPWIHVVPAGTIETEPVGRDLRTPAGEIIIGWCLEACREGDRVRQGAAARALAGLGWPAALGLLEQRWLVLGDVAALEGLLAAAARGRVVPSLQRADVIERVLRLVDDGARSLAAARREAETLDGPEAEVRRSQLDLAELRLSQRARRFAHGLGALAPVAIVREVEGKAFEALGDALARDFDGAPPLGRWLRLASAPAGSEVGQRLWMRALICFEGRLEAVSRRQALRCLGGPVPPGGRAPELRDPEAFFAGLGPRVEGVGLELGLAAVSAPDDAAWVRRLRPRAGLLAELVVWAFLAGRDGGALPPWRAEVLARAMADGEVLALARERAGGAARPGLGGFLETHLERLPERSRAAARRALLRAGLAGDTLAGEALGAALRELEAEGRPKRMEEAWLDLGSLAAHPVHGARAVDALGEAAVRALGQRSSATGGGIALVRALEAAVQGLLAARKDAAAESLVENVQEAAVVGDHPLAGALLDSRWPPLAVRPALDLERLDPVLPRR